MQSQQYSRFDLRSNIPCCILRRTAHTIEVLVQVKSTIRCPTQNTVSYVRSTENSNASEICCIHIWLEVSGEAQIQERKLMFIPESPDLSLLYMSLAW